jgi:hypothetical protein
MPDPETVAEEEEKQQVDPAMDPNYWHDKHYTSDVS